MSALSYEEASRQIMTRMLDSSKPTPIPLCKPDTKCGYDRDCPCKTVVEYHMREALRND